MTGRQNADPFAELVSREDERIELARACLQIAEDAYPGLDVEGYVGELDRFETSFASQILWCYGEI